MLGGVGRAGERPILTRLGLPRFQEILLYFQTPSMTLHWPVSTPWLPQAGDSPIGEFPSEVTYRNPPVLVKQKFPVQRFRALLKNDGLYN